MRYDNIFIPMTDSSCVRVTMLTFDTDAGPSGISAGNGEVMEIMESIKVK